MDTVECVVDCRNQLGEGACWDAAAGILYWLDVPMPSSLWALDPATGTVEHFDMPEMITSISPRRNGKGLLVASHGGINFWDRATGLSHVLRPEPQKPFNRCNDGASDAAGRFWFGTMQNNVAPDASPIDLVANTGSLFRLDPDLTLHEMETGIGVSNTMSWSPDGRTLYFCDTLSGWMSAYDFDPAAGTVSNKRNFARFDRGVPDGSTVDAEGYLWNARWDGGCIVRFAPDGSVDRVVEVPSPLVTSCVFGGADLDTLYITTARYLQDDAALAKAPQAGSLFALKPGVRGQPGNRFAG